MTSSPPSASCETPSTDNHFTLLHPSIAEALFTFEERVADFSAAFDLLSQQHNILAAKYDELLGTTLKLRTQLAIQVVALVKCQGQEYTYTQRGEAKTSHGGNVSSADDEDEGSKTKKFSSNMRENNCTATACNTKSDASPPTHQTPDLLSPLLSKDTKKTPRLILRLPSRPDGEKAAPTMANQGQSSKGRRAKRNESSFLHATTMKRRTKRVNV
ncbi:hypothetical protein ACJQWK_04029 [Exserohilum turcicum]|uniref:Uncharacterized protein n=1 Tax=Exserohilum turcicum (strain 28A) TaxID=671987 RepID=R0J5I3_EXST2|nr:uncharacterized protein SETTUDRAFT_18790 [Exserohilum turcica Et28A]EOA92140.1 hypothetical protein SETTUDRAFT_18790 [Exserohilum turcica Et28A]